MSATQLAPQVNKKSMSNKNQIRTILRMIALAVLIFIIAINNHWSITLGFCYVVFTLEAFGSISSGLISQVEKIKKDLIK